MGVVNVTPDSFSDGGRFFEPQAAVKQAERLISEGSAVIDIGAESTRPGAEPVSEDDECARAMPVIKELMSRRSCVISIDTCKYETARRAIDAGASIINDISGLQREPRLARLAAETGAGLVIMHMRGAPQTMQSLTDYDDLTGEVNAFFRRQIDFAVSEGVEPGQIAIDPGIGFSKTAEQNLTLIRLTHEWAVEGFPIVLGVSRKSFIGKITGAEADGRIWGTAGAVAAGVMRGAHVLRVHDVAEMKQAAETAWAIQSQSMPEQW